MTLAQILTQVHQHRPMSLDHLRRTLKAQKIKPLGLRQRPQQYPDDSADKVLAALGFTPATEFVGAINGVTGIVSMKTLRSVKAKARGK